MTPRPGDLVAVGNTSTIHAYGPDRVVKLSSPDTPEHWAPLEAEWTRQLHLAGVPVPEVIDLIEVDGRPAIVLERIQGPTMLELIAAQRREVPALAREFAALHVWVHAQPPPAGLPVLTERLRGKIDEASGIEPDARREAARRIDTQTVTVQLCHGDFHPGNIVMSPRGPVFLDWFDVAVGPPVADVLRTSILIRPRPLDGPPVHLPGLGDEILERFHRGYLAAYQDLSPLEPGALETWVLPVTVARCCERGPHHDLASVIADAMRALAT